MKLPVKMALYLLLNPSNPIPYGSQQKGGAQYAHPWFSKLPIRQSTKLNSNIATVVVVPFPIVQVHFPLPLYHPAKLAYHELNN